MFVGAKGVKVVEEGVCGSWELVVVENCLLGVAVLAAVVVVLHSDGIA